MHLFLDCEFNGWHDQGTGELISLGLVSADGKYEFYEVVNCQNPSPFVVGAFQFWMFGVASVYGVRSVIS